MITLSQVWSHVETFLADGISLIPVRDKDEKNKYGEVLVAKSTYGKWKEFQTRRMGKTELWHAMEERNTTAVAIICGKVSGNMEVIDIDVKYNPGIDAILFADIQSFYPDLFGKLRIHKTPSGGYHIIYRVDEAHAVPGNLKLAGRMATDQEIQSQLDRGLKRPNKEVNFLETRAEGGYILAPPSLGYSIHQDHPIPLLSWEERCSIVRLCESYTTIIKEAPKPTLTKKEDEWYDENPFEHYNRTVDPTQVVADFGWKYLRENAQFIWYTRPDKQRGVSLSWNKQKHIFYVFTSSTELQANKGYHPSTIMAELGFAGDKKQAYKWLTSNGYGIVKPSVEASIVKKAAHAGKGVPANFSDNAKEQLSIQSEQLKENHPYGPFIKYDSDEEKYTVSREAIAYVSKMLGFRYLDGDLVRIDGFKIKHTDERYYQDTLKSYIWEEDADEYEKLCNIYEAFIQKNGKFTIQRLEKLNEELILKDSRETCYKFYRNGYLVISASSIDFNNYTDFAQLIWEDRIQNRNYVPSSGGRFVEYLKLAVIDQVQAKKILGYLSHEYKDETTGFIIVLTEQCPDPKEGGGSGKNVFCNLLKLTTTYTSKPGSQAKFDEKFFQSWNRQKIFGISDVDSNFDFLFLKEPATGSFIWKKLFKDEVEVSVDDAPKFIVQTNYSYEVKDGGLKRRIIPLEFTNFFTLAGGLDMHFGCHFPKGWDEEDFAGFDTYIAESVQLWMKAGLKLYPGELTDTGWQKQWEQTYGNATRFILEYWDQWVIDGYVTNETFKRNMQEFYEEHNIQKHFWPSSVKLNTAMQQLAEKNGMHFKKDVSKRFADKPFKCRVFFKEGSEPKDDHDDSPPF